MANEKTFQSRIINKHDIEENWLKATAFIPKSGEIIIYDIDDNYNYQRLKIGDGITSVNNLPFYSNTFELISTDDIDTICGATIIDTTSEEVTF